MPKHGPLAPGAALTAHIAGPLARCARSSWLISARQSAKPLLACCSPVAQALCALSDPRTDPITFKVNHLACAFAPPLPLIRPLLLLHPHGHRLVIGSPFFNRRAVYFGLAFPPFPSPSLVWSQDAARTAVAVLGPLPDPPCAPISRPASTVRHGEGQLLFATLFLIFLEDACSILDDGANEGKKNDGGSEEAARKLANRRQSSAESAESGAGLLLESSWHPLLESRWVDLSCTTQTAAHDRTRPHTATTLGQR